MPHVSCAVPPQRRVLCCCLPLHVLFCTYVLLSYKFSFADRGELVIEYREQRTEYNKNSLRSLQANFSSLFSQEGQFIIFISRGNLQNIPALSKLQQTAVQATETGQMMFERWITASLLLREERVLLPPLL